MHPRTLNDTADKSGPPRVQIPKTVSRHLHGASPDHRDVLPYRIFGKNAILQSALIMCQNMTHHIQPMIYALKLTHSTPGRTRGGRRFFLAKRPLSTNAFAEHRSCIVCITNARRCTDAPCPSPIVISLMIAKKFKIRSSYSILCRRDTSSSLSARIRPVRQP